MPKELIISSTPQETKAAILENDQVVEIYIEREKDHSIVGSICKGRVTKVLPGMQSAFVDIGLERDAFLYVSDFFEDTEEYDKLVSTAEEQVAKLEQGGKEAPPADVEPPSIIPGAAPEAAPGAPGGGKFADHRGRTRRARRNRLRGKRFEETPVEEAAPVPAVEIPPVEAAPPPSILPGESLAKYQNRLDQLLQENSQEPAAQEEQSDSGHSFNASLEPAVQPEASPSDSFLTSAKESALQDNPLEMPEVPAASAFSDWMRPATEEAAPPEEDRPLDGDFKTEPFKGFSISNPETEPALPPAAAESKPPIVSWTWPQPKAEEPLPNLNSQEAALTDSSTPSPFAFLERPLEVQEDKAESLPSTSPLTPGNAEEAPASAVAPVAGEQGNSAEPTPIKAPSAPSAPSKAEIRNPHNTAKFFRRGDSRRRPHGHAPEKKETAAGGNHPLIADLLKEGQEILVQVAKEPLGTKGARITSHIALPGRHLVYMPTVDHIGVSRKIDSDEERQRLKRIIQEQRGNLPGGFIVRTAGQGRGEEEFKADIQYLSSLWSDIRSKMEKKSAPILIHRDLNLIQRLLRDHLSADYTAIRVDNEVEFAAILEFVNHFQPSMVSRIKLYLKEVPIFEEFGVQAEIEKALRNKVWLKSGGYIVIDQAEALVAIDVNTGKYVGKSNKLEDTIVKTNLDAAKEIARQIRLRDLGGIIVCDFIDMEDRKNRQKVTQALEEALRNDKSPSKILQFNDFGLVAITRKRVKQSLMKTLCEPCPSCSGSGLVKSAQTICYEIQAETKRMAKTLENGEITIRVHPTVARALKTTEASVITEIETTLKKEVFLKSDPLLHQEHFDIF